MYEVKSANWCTRSISWTHSCECILLSRIVWCFAQAPHGPSQGALVVTAMSNAGQNRLGYIAAHGTGTPLGDPIETGALQKSSIMLSTAGSNSIRTRFTVGGIKALVGHLEGTAGLAGVTLAVMNLQQSLAPALRYRSINPFVAASLTVGGATAARLPIQVIIFNKRLHCCGLEKPMPNVHCCT